MPEEITEEEIRFVKLNRKVIGIITASHFCSFDKFITSQAKVTEWHINEARKKEETK